MNDDELGGLLAESARRRVRNVRPQGDPDELLHRIDARAKRHRLLAVALGVGLAIAGLVAGLGLARAGDDDAPAVAPAEATATTTAPALVPSDAAAARAAIAGAYLDVFSSGAASDQRSAAVQDGFDADLFARGREAGLAVNLTPEQMSAVTVSTSEITFVDSAHATVRFAIEVPGNAAISVTRTGYAVYEDGRWKVAWRTACDVLQLVADETTCPRAG